MKNFLLPVLLFLFVAGFSQHPSVISQSSILAQLQAGDSIIYYQCHVKDHYKEYNLPSGEIATGKIEKYSVTEKFVITREDSGYKITGFVSPLVPFPNRRFSGLKIREKPYWNFIKEKTAVISDSGLTFLSKLEKSGREAIEYDYAITKYTTNQLIIKHGKDFKQLVIEGNDLIGETFFKEKQ